MDRTPLEAYSRYGKPIVGTFESIPAKAAAKVTRLDGQTRIQYLGGSEVYWDDQRPQKSPQGERLFLDADGEIVAESDLVWKPIVP